MPSESIVSLELAAAAAAVVLTARLFALIQATRGVPAAHAQIESAVSSGEFSALRRRIRGMGYRNPYGEVAAELVRAGAQASRDLSKRSEVVAHSAEIAKNRMIRRTQQGQVGDSMALAFAGAVVFFARSTLPEGPVFWSMSGVIVVLLLSSLVVRGRLQTSVLASLEALKSTLIARPQLPSLSGEAVDCLWCGAPTERIPYRLEAQGSGQIEDVEATVCIECGKFIATISPLGGEPISVS